VIMPHQSAKSSIASNKACNKDSTFVADPKVMNNIEENIETLEDWELFEITHDSFQDYETQEQKRKAQKQLQHEAKQMRTLNEMWSVKDFLEQGTLSSHQQGKHAKRASLLDDEDIKLVARTWLHSIPPKNRSPLALKKELETNIFLNCLEVSQKNYRAAGEQYDGDEMKNAIPPEWLKIWDMRHVLVTHDEVYLSFWVEDEESIIKKKGQGLAIMVSDFLCAYYGPLRLTEADAT
ncbi:17946_t:CDS:2, partial [Dentiscutata erythropus]